MIRTHIVRCFSTRTIVDKWFNALQSTTHNEQQSKLAQCIEYSLHQHPSIHSDLVKEIIHRWAIEQPTRQALWINECQKLTFKDIYTQASHLAQVLTGSEFNLTTGKNVLVILPYSTKERLLLQLACLQNDLIFCPYDFKHLTEGNIRQQIRTSAIDCIITDVDHLEMIMISTRNSIRPLKKGLIHHEKSSEPLPIGWKSLIQTENKDLQIDFIQPMKLSSRHLTSDRPINLYSQARFSVLQLLAAYWLNMNKSPNFIWIKGGYPDKLSLAPWLLGSAIFYRETDSITAMLKTFEKYPIDTFCASSNEYQMLDKQYELETSTHLEQLLSTEPITDPMVKSRWYTLTNIRIQDDCIDIPNVQSENVKKLDLKSI